MTEETLHNPIAESYWRAKIVSELELAKGQFVSTESEEWAYDKAITVAKGIK